MTIYFNQHFGMTYGVSNDFPEIQQNDGKWQLFNNTETRIPQNYDIVKGYERHLSWGCERIARIALGILCIIATLGFGLLTESVRRCFTGRQVLIIVTPKNEKSEKNEKFDASEKPERIEYIKLCKLPQLQIDRYEEIKDGIGNLTLPLPDWNNEKQVKTWANEAVRRMQNFYPLPEEPGEIESFVVNCEAAAYGYIRHQIDIAPIENERKSHLLCNIDQLMYDNALTRIENSEHNRGLETNYARLYDLAQRFYDRCRAQGISDLDQRIDIRIKLYEDDKDSGLAKN